MKGLVLRAVVIGAAAFLASGCTSMSGGDGGIARAQVTRFHLGQPIARGEITVQAADPATGGSPDFARIRDAVAAQLTTLGWQVVPNAQSEQVAVIGIQQGTRAELASRPAVSFGLGGGFGGGGSGVGVGGGVSIPIGRARGRDIIVTQLAVRIQRRSDGSAVWEGRAQGEARGGSSLADRGAAAERLAPALFQGFPGESGRTISVR